MEGFLGREGERWWWGVFVVEKEQVKMWSLLWFEIAFGGCAPRQTLMHLSMSEGGRENNAASATLLVDLRQAFVRVQPRVVSTTKIVFSVSGAHYPDACVRKSVVLWLVLQCRSVHSLLLCQEVSEV